MGEGVWFWRLGTMLDMHTVLALGGGGIKALRTARFLAAVGPHLRPDLIVGTSAGGIIACAIAMGKPLSSLPDFFRRYGPSIFKRRFLGGIVRAKYGNGPGSGLYEALRMEFGQAQMKDCMVDTMVVCVWKRSNELALIKSWRDRLLIRDACICTSAAPTYFPAHIGRIDGGVSRNNPVTVAIAEALKRWMSVDEDGGVRVEPFRLLSIECTRGREGSDSEDVDWGALQWVTKGGLVDTLMDSGRDAAHHEAKMMMAGLGMPYLSIGGEVGAGIAMDDASPHALARLEDAAGRLIERDLEGCIDWLKEHDND